MKSTIPFDYLIIGGGLAGLQLALAFSEDKFFSDKKIGIIEPSAKNANDKTWCFWEKGRGKWESILHHQWNDGFFKSKKEELPLSMGNYSYKMIRSATFYEFAKNTLANCGNIEWIQDEVISVENNYCTGKKSRYNAAVVFDSRISPDFFTNNKHIHIKQPFKGWLIKTDDPQFNPKQFTMMDYSLNYKDYCCFTYVLPTSAKEALIEFTFFIPELVDDAVYDGLLKKYINEQLEVDNYSISEVEQGIVPMSSYPFWKENTNNYLKIGTAGGWVKSSSGYSFKSTERKVAKVLENIKAGKRLDMGLFSKKHQFYDRIMLRVLQNENEFGKELFKTMYFKNSTAQIFKFLDEATTFAEEIKIINRFKKAPFLRSLMKEI